MEIKELKSYIYIDECYTTFQNPIPFGKKKSKYLSRPYLPMRSCHQVRINIEGFIAF